jgi:dTDP-4-dehydrorhamnose 3,5-epimerase
VNRFKVLDLPLNGLKVIERNPLGDSRGFLSRLFCLAELSNVGWIKPISQINHTLTNQRGTLRGMHYQQPPYAEMKLVSCIRGKSWHVSVDLRAKSPTFLHWHAETLSATNNRALLIPEGFAHGFQTLCDDVELIYCHSTAHRSEAEAALNAIDPRLAISWPLEITERSLRDTTQLVLDSNFKGIEL